MVPPVWEVSGFSRYSVELLRHRHLLKFAVSSLKGACAIKMKIIIICQCVQLLISGEDTIISGDKRIC